nr:MAG TPA: hypothetical protein [Caudoviricetes sp.]
MQEFCIICIFIHIILYIFMYIQLYINAIKKGYRKNNLFNYFSYILFLDFITELNFTNKLYQKTIKNQVFFAAEIKKI